MQVPFHTAALGGNYDVSVHRGSQTERLSVKIPAGIEEGQTIRLAGQGHPGVQGGPAGDMLVTVNIAPHPYFRREGANLLVDVPVTITEAVLGGKIDVPTLDEGTVTMTLPAGTASGSKLRLRGKGIASPKSKSKGDQYAVIKIVPPRTVDGESRELLERFAELNPQAPRAGMW